MFFDQKMLKSLFTYSLTLLLLFSITVPTIVSLSDYDICETSLLLDIEEDTDSNEKSEEVKELKILNTEVAHINVSSTNNKATITTYNSELYQTIYHSLESPPPELS